MARILCTVTNDLAHDRRMHRMAGSLVAAGHQVSLVGRRLPTSATLPERPWEQVRLPCRFRRGKAFYLEYNLRLLGYLLRVPLDIVCAVDLDTLLPALWASRLRGKPCVYDAHEFFSEVPELLGRPGVQAAWEALARYAIPRTHARYTVGASLAAQLQGRYGAPFRVVRNLPPRRSEVPRHRWTEPPVFLYQGALNRGRGLEAALRALTALPGASLLLAGEGDLSQSLRRLARQLGVADQAQFLGWVAPEQLPALADRATLGLNLLEARSLSYLHSAANKAFDYIQAGLPSLQMDFPEYRRLHEQHGVFELLSEASPEAIVARVKALREDPDRYARLAAACRRAAEQLHWAREEPELLDIFQQLSR